MTEDVRKSGIELKTILPSICVMILVGCQSSATIPPKPTKPTIDRDKVTEQNGQVCVARDDMSALLDYIIDLEAVYE